MMLLAILLVAALPNQVAVDNIRIWWHLIGIRRDALRLGHNIPSWGNVNPHYWGCRLHHHRLLHHRLLHHRLLHHRLLHHRLLHHLLLHHWLLHLHLWLLLRLLRSLIVSLDWLWSRFGTTHLCIY